MLTMINKPSLISVERSSEYASAAAQAATVLAQGGLVVAPTETRYGLLASTDRADAMIQVTELKRRSATKPVAVFVGHMEEIESLAEMPPAARKLAEAFLPGPLTLVLAARIDWPPPLVVDGRIGLRYSSSPFMAALMGTVGSPLTATSANLSGSPEAESIDQIQAAFGDRVDLYLDGGRLSGPVTTVVDASGDGVKILREGAILRRQIGTVLGEKLSG